MKIKIANSQGKIFGELPPFAVETLYERLAFIREGDEWSPRVAEGKWDGVRRLYRKWDAVFPAGLLGMVRSALDDSHVEYEVEDIRSRPLANRQWRADLPFELRYYQRETVDICKRIGRGVCSLPTASGKTVTFSVLIGELGVSPTVVYVPSILLLTQTADAIREFVRSPDGKPVDVGIVGDGVCEIRDITVMTVQTAITAYNMEYDPDKGTVRKLTKAEIARVNSEPYKPKRRNTEDPDRTEDLGFVKTNKSEIRSLIQSARVVICDEAHRAASFIWQEVLKKSKAAYYRFAFSATPWREDNTGMLITASFGRVIYEKTNSELIREGFLSRPYVFMVRVPSSMIPAIEMESYKDVVKHCIVRNEPRNRLIAAMAEALSPLGPTLLLVQEIPHGRELEEIIEGSQFIYAKTSKKKKQEAIRRLLAGELPVLIATPIGDEGLDLVELRVLILCHAGKSAGKLKQRVGRTSRIHEGKDYSVVVDLRDQVEYLSTHGRRREKVFLQEEEWVVVRVTPEGWTSLTV